MEAQVVGQLGFFDLGDRYTALSAAGDPLERLHLVQLCGVAADEDRRLDAYGLDRLRAVAPLTVVDVGELDDAASPSGRLLVILADQDAAE
jgi:hypothetical protein